MLEVDERKSISRETEEEQDLTKTEGRSRGRSEGELFSWQLDRVDSGTSCIAPNKRPQICSSEAK